MTGTNTIVQAVGTALGVDTHKDMNVADALDQLGRRLAQRSVPTTEAGPTRSVAVGEALGPDRAWGIEGTGSYGAGLTRYLRAAGETVHEVSRPDRRVRRDRGKSDPIDAEVAARTVLAGQVVGAPKAGNGAVEALRQLRATRRAALKARTQAANLLHALLVTAPADLRVELGQGTLRTSCTAASGCGPGRSSMNERPARSHCVPPPAAGSTCPRRSPSSTPPIAELTAHAAPALLERFGVGPDVAAALLIAAGGTTNGSAARPPSPRSAGSTRSPRPRAKRTGTGSTGAVTGKPTRPCTPWP